MQLSRYSKRKVMVDRTKRNHYNANRQAGARRPSWAKDQIGGKGRGHCPHSSPFPVAMTKGSHLFPYRTQKLSLSAPMVLGWRRPGRVGRCRIPQNLAIAGFFFCRSHGRRAEGPSKVEWVRALPARCRIPFRCFSIKELLFCVGMCYTGRGVDALCSMLIIQSAQ